MKVSQGVPCGRKIELYHPELFDDRDEVIIYTRDEFRRTFSSMQDQIDFITRWDMILKLNGEHHLLGAWPVIMDRVHILGTGLNLFYCDEPSQAYLDTYLYEEVKAKDEGVVKSVVKEAEGPWEVNWL
ncbi:MAG: hypothetical protein ABFC34_12275 [Methanobacterium sp.]